MRDILQPSGAKGIGLLSGRFYTARARLTSIYVAILACVLFLSSGILYSALSTRIQHRFERFPSRMGMVYPPEVIPPRAEDMLTDVMNSLMLVNGFLLLAGGVFSYWFAGLTLEPIQVAYDRQKQFVSDASHELRTPLAILQIDLENALVMHENEEEHERIQGYLVEVKRMGYLVADLLTLSRLEEDRVAVYPKEPLSVYALLTQAVRRFQSVAERHGVQLHTDFTQEQDVELVTNETLLLHAISNVVANAILYNKKEGSVALHAGRDHERVYIDVVDTGVGIPEHELERVFERFYRAYESRSRQTGGSGLGLAIVQSIMTELGGEIAIESHVGSGTRVRLFFPSTKPS